MPVELHLYDLHPAQRQIRAEAKRFNVVVAGRRSGKTTLGSDLVVETILDDHAPCGWFTPTYKNLEETWRGLKALLAPITTSSSEVLHRIDVLGSGFIECWSLDSENVADAVRGRHYKRIITDESASIVGLLSIFNKVLRPMLVDLKGDAWFLGSPKGFNDFQVLYQRGQDPLYETWASWQLPVTVNPYIDLAEIAEIKSETPEDDFNQEYMAQFVASGNGVYRNVTACVNDERHFDPEPGHKYGFGVDWGQMNDFSAVSVMDLTTKDQVWMERFNRVDWEFQYEQIKALADRYKPILSLVELNSIGQPGLEALARRGLRVQGWVSTNATKARMIQDLALAFSGAEIGILDDKVQTAELLAYTATRTPSGLWQYGAPAGMHDDTVIALALSWQLAKRPPSRPQEITFEVAAG